uniref:Retrotransposon gag domain-containing protein n=1 Tax=Tanacetum cinerariifolium TaxID=118510 RepID=A0A6L2KFM2_TANCI|nr:hypothetical protein [Tanacetum cinerariifolium]
MFVASTFEGRALTWWNGNVHTLGLVNANRIPWSEFKIMMITEYCPATEIQRIEQELWTLNLKGDDIEAYNNRFHELALMCPELVSNEKKKIERYIRGFPKGIKGNMTSSRPTTLHDAINMAHELVEQAVQGRAARISKSNKRKWEDQQGNNHHQQQNQRQDAAKAYVVALAKGRGYAECDMFWLWGEWTLQGHVSKRKKPQNEGARGGAYVMRTEDPQQDPKVITVTASLSIHLVCYRHQLNSGDQSSLRGIDCEIS